MGRNYRSFRNKGRVSKTMITSVKTGKKKPLQSKEAINKVQTSYKWAENVFKVYMW